MLVLTVLMSGGIVPRINTCGVSKMSTQQIDRLEESIAALQAQLDRMCWKFQCPTCGRKVKNLTFGSLKPSEAITTVLREQDTPIGVGSLKKRLSERGYPMERFGPRHHYFYTLICRLVRAGKIQRLEGDEIMSAG